MVWPHGHLMTNGFGPHEFCHDVMNVFTTLGRPTIKRLRKGWALFRAFHYFTRGQDRDLNCGKKSAQSKLQSECMILDGSWMSTCNWLVLKTLGSRPMMPKNLPGHWH